MSWRRAILAWCALVTAEVVHGTLRVWLLVPVVGDFRSRQLAVFSGAAIVVTIAVLSARWIGAGSDRERLEVGGAWLAGMLCFELTAGRWLAHLSWERILSDYDLVHGGLLPIGMAVVLVAPLIADRLLRRRGSGDR